VDLVDYWWGEYLAGCMQCSSLPGVGYGLQRMAMDSPGQIGCSLFSFLSLLNWGREKGRSSNNDSHANRLCSSHFSALGHRKSKRQEKEKKE